MRVRIKTLRLCALVFCMHAMAECKCPDCKAKMVDFTPYLGDVVCPKCSSHDVSGWMKRSSLKSVVVDWRCGCCGHVWSGSYVLPKNLFG